MNKLVILSITLLLVITSCDLVGSSDAQIVKMLSNPKFKDYFMLKRADLEFTQGCEPKTDPRFVVADFNGDGIKDYALLLRQGGIKGTSAKNGKPNNRADIILIVIVSDKGKYTKSVIGKIGEYYPLFDIYIHLIKPGMVKESEAAMESHRKRKEVLITKFAFELVYCERSSIVYYWDKKSGSFDNIWTSD